MEHFALQQGSDPKPFSQLVVEDRKRQIVIDECVAEGAAASLPGLVAVAGMFVHARLSKVCERKALQLEQSLRSQK